MTAWATQSAHFASSDRIQKLSLGFGGRESPIDLVLTGRQLSKWMLSIVSSVYTGTGDTTTQQTRDIELLLGQCWTNVGSMFGVCRVGECTKYTIHYCIDKL